MKDNWVQVKKR